MITETQYIDLLKERKAIIDSYKNEEPHLHKPNVRKNIADIMSRTSNTNEDECMQLAHIQIQIEEFEAKSPIDARKRVQLKMRKGECNEQ